MALVHVQDHPNFKFKHVNFIIGHAWNKKKSPKKDFVQCPVQAVKPDFSRQMRYFNVKELKSRF